MTMNEWAEGVVQRTEAQEQRLTWLKRFRQREGLRKPVPDAPLELFGATSWDSLIAVLMAGHMEVAQKLGPVGTVVLTSAYGMTPLFEMDEAAPLSVIDRRKALSKQLDTSVRTLERQEESAIALLLQGVNEVLSDSYMISQVMAARRALRNARWRMGEAGIEVPEETWTGIFDGLKTVRDTLESSLRRGDA